MGANLAVWHRQLPGLPLTCDFLYDFLWFEWRWKAQSCGKLFIQWGSNCISCLISASCAAQVTYIPPPPHRCSNLERKAFLPRTTTPKPAGVQCWEAQYAHLEPTIHLLQKRTSPWLPKEPDENYTGLGSPWGMCLVVEEGGAMLSAILMPSRCMRIKMWARGFPSPLLFLHHLCPLFWGAVWGGLGLFTGVFLPLVEFCHSGRRAGVSVGGMNTHCTIPGVRKCLEMCGRTSEDLCVLCFSSLMSLLGM